MSISTYNRLYSKNNFQTKIQKDYYKTKDLRGLTSILKAMLLLLANNCKQVNPLATITKYKKYSY
ncbi:hypothetical protein MASR1M45_11470 [Candidatus Kapaibacterium sp.]